MQIWECKSCGFEFEGEDGLCEMDPNDFGTTHSVEAYHCAKCGNVKNVFTCISLDSPNPENGHLCRNDNKICENCGIEMQPLKRNILKIFKKYYKCPKCGKKTFRFVKEDECWT